MTTRHEITTALRGIDMSKLSPQDKLTLLGVIFVLDDGEPDDEGWIEWAGDARGPNIPLDAVVEAELTNGLIKVETNRWWIGLTGKGFNNWDKNDHNASVILRYRVVK